MSRADFVFTNGKIFTVDDEFTVVAALAVCGESIVAVGTWEDVLPCVGPNTEIVDLAGKSVIPGINDSHLHGIAFGLDTPPLSLDLSYPAVKSLADIRECIREAVADAQSGDWIVGTGWDDGYLEECLAEPGRMPHRVDIDDISPHNPVFLQDYSRHTSWVNSAALRIAGVDESSPVPDGGVVDTNPDGSLTGVFREGAQALVQRVLPPLTRERREQAIRSTVAKLQELGITSFTDPALGPGGELIAGGAAGAEGLQVYADLAAQEELGVRVSTLLLPAGMSGSAAEFEQNLEQIQVPAVRDLRRFQVLGVKVFADGIPPSGTAWMHQEYVGGGCGSLCVSGDTDEQRVAEVTGMILAGHKAGYQVGVHVTGDRAIDTVVDAIIAAQEAHPRPNARHYLIHGDFVSESALRRMAAHGIGVNMNPTIKWTIADLEVGVVGSERAAYEWPYRSALEAGVMLMSSSDAPVTTPDWRQGLSTMILREGKASGEVSGPEQRIGLEAALRTYTSSPAWQDFAEEWKGSLEVGKVADLCVLDADLERIDPHDMPHMPVVMTMVGGTVVHRTIANAVTSA
ncbi:amidohydrolase [Arthrobacter sp. YN]|uniref:amidohydrolase n=1 Tax=Arthrobacter sp. YN TaxID=2020486 RepID=UPI000B5EB421|nr:amidohydrolase [Arthrobacter sp. YN]ASN20062.1 amidohydrolase [Arthrobacter sp. YN]